MLNTFDLKNYYLGTAVFAKLRDEDESSNPARGIIEEVGPWTFDIGLGRRITRSGAFGAGGSRGCGEPLRSRSSPTSSFGASRRS